MNLRNRTFLTAQTRLDGLCWLSTCYSYLHTAGDWPTNNILDVSLKFTRMHVANFKLMPKSVVYILSDSDSMHYLGPGTQQTIIDMFNR